MSAQDKNISDPGNGEYDILNELKRIPRVKADDDFLERLHLKIAEIESQAEIKDEKSLLDHLIGLITNRYTVIAAGLALILLIIYLFMPGDNDQVITKKSTITDSAKISQTDRTQESTKSQNNNIKSDTLTLQKQLTVKDQSDQNSSELKPVTPKKKIHKRKLRDRDREPLQKSEEKFLARAAIETEIFRKKMKALDRNWLEGLKEKVDG